MTTATDGDRLSRLEGAYEHLATKADLERLRGDLQREMEQMRGDLQREMEQMRGDLQREMEQMRGGLQGEMERMRGDLRGEMQAMENRLLIRLGGIVGLAAAITVAVVRITG